MSSRRSKHKGLSRQVMIQMAGMLQYEPKVTECAFCHTQIAIKGSDTSKIHYCSLYCKERQEKASDDATRVCEICGRPMTNRFGTCCSRECLRKKVSRNDH